MKKTTLLKLALIFLMAQTLFSQVTISGTNHGQTHTITLTQDTTVTGISIVGDATVLTINGNFTLTNSDSTNGTVLTRGTLKGTGHLKTSFIDRSNNWEIQIARLTITGVQHQSLVFGTSANTLTLSGGGTGIITMGGGNNTVVVSSIYSGLINGEGGTDTLHLSGGTVSGRLSNFENLAVSGTSTLNSNLTVNDTTLNTSSSLSGTGHLTTGTTSGTGTLNVAQTTITGEQTNALTFGAGANSLTLSGGGSGDIDMGSENDNVIISSTYTGDLDGGAGTDTLQLQGGTVSGAISNFETLILNRTSTLNSNLTVSGNTALRTSSTTSGTGALTTGTISGTGTLNLSQVTITGSQISTLTLGAGANSLTLSGGGSGDIDMGSENDNVIISSTYTGDLDGGAGTDTLRLLGGTVSGNLSGFEIFQVRGESSVLDSDLTVSQGIGISGALKISRGRTLTTGSGYVNQVTGQLDISALADNVRGIGGDGITVVAGGTLVVGTAKNRNASNIILRRGSDSSSAVSIDLGSQASTSTTPIFSTLPTLTRTGKVNLSISGSLAKGATQVFVRGDQRENYRISLGNFELIFDGENTLIKTLVPYTGQVLKAYQILSKTNATIDIDVVESAVNTASSAVSVASSAVTSTAMSTNSFIKTRTVSLATGKTQGAKGPDKESKLLNYNVWSDFSLGFGGLDSDSDKKGYDFSSYSIRMGIDKRLANSIFGFAFSYTTTSLDNEGTTSESDLTTLGFSFYRSYTKLEKYRIDYLLSYAFNYIDLSTQAGTGSVYSNLLDLDVTTHYTGYKEYTPFVSLRLLLNDISGYNLFGTLPMQVEGESYNSFYFTFGTRWDRAWQTKIYKHNLGLKSSFHYNLLDTARETKATFHGSTQPFELQGVEEDSFNIGFGIDYALVKAKMTWLFSYDMFLGSSSQSNHLTIKASYRF